MDLTPKQEAWLAEKAANRAAEPVEPVRSEIAHAERGASPRFIRRHLSQRRAQPKIARIVRRHFGPLA